MNNQRRKEILNVIFKINNLKIDNMTKDEIDDIIYDIESIQNDEENYRDNIPENLQGGYRYEASDEACDNLSYAYDYISEINEAEDKQLYLNKAIEYLNDASL